MGPRSNCTALLRQERRTCLTIRRLSNYADAVRATYQHSIHFGAMPLFRGLRQSSFGNQPDIGQWEGEYPPRERRLNGVRAAATLAESERALFFWSAYS